MLDPTSSFGRRFKTLPTTPDRRPSLWICSGAAAHDPPYLPLKAPGTGTYQSLFFQILVRLPHEKACFFERAARRHLTFVQRQTKREAEAALGCKERLLFGEVAEWFKAAVLKTAVRESVPWVRIPPSPPDIILSKLLIFQVEV